VADAYVPSAAAIAAKVAALARIDQLHRDYPQCVVCGQRALALDTDRCCSKTTEPHRIHRAEARSGAYR
jgi:hypothetical protein